MHSISYNKNSQTCPFAML